nr:MAG TPA: hypothetical protein [Bacteriophage sp.]
MQLNCSYVILIYGEQVIKLDVRQGKSERTPFLFHSNVLCFHYSTGKKKVKV